MVNLQPTNSDDDLTFLYQAFNAHNLGTVQQGLRAGASIEAAIKFYSRYQYPPQRISGYD